MPRPQLYDDTLRFELIGQAAAAIADGGVQHLSLRAVATAAGTSTNAVYTLFGSKDGLVEAALGTAAQSFTAAQVGVGTSVDPVADLVGLGQAYRTWAVSHPELYAVMFGGRVSLPQMGGPGGDCGPADESISPLVSAVVRLVEDGIFAGAPTEQIVQTIWASVHGLVSLELAAWPDRAAADRQALYDAQLGAIVRAWRQE